MALLELADLALTFCVEFYAKCLTAFAGVNISDEINRQWSSLLDISDCIYDIAAIDMDPRAIGSALILEIEHLLPNPIPILRLTLIQ